jgi:hypothetical protein
MIDLLDDTLAALLRRELREDFAEQVQISFAAPDDQFPPSTVTLPAVDLFLYDLRENLELRDNDSYVERGGDASAVRRPPPVRVDASYLITAWPSMTGNDPAKDEHRLLGKVMGSLLRYRELPADVLSGELSTQSRALPLTVLQPGRLQSLGEFWQALGGKPKAALNCTVTLAIEVGAPETVKLVTEKVIKVRLDTGEAR